MLTTSRHSAEIFSLILYQYSCVCLQATVNEKDSAEKTALHYCADNLETQCAEMVLEKDKSIIDWKDEQGYTPMALAVIAGNMNLLKLLIREGADIDCVDNEGHKLSHWAAGMYSVPVYHILSKGAQWLSGRVLDSRPKGCRFETCRRHCVD